MQAECRLTTADNPYDPFEQFDLWWIYDVTHGYDTSGYVGRIAKIAGSMTDEEENAENERAIDEIIKYDDANIYRKVRRKS